GDASFESLIFPFDTPPSAATLLLDASYGLYDAGQAQCQAAILKQLAKPTVLPLPLTGRAIELAVWLSGLENEHTVNWTMDSHCQLALRQLVRSSPDMFQTGVYEVLQRLASQHWPERARIMLVADQNDGYLDWPEHQVLHTGYLTPERRRRVAAGVELWRRWNVHFRASDLVQLRDSLNARQVVPLFTMLNPTTAWQARLGPCLYTDTTLDLNHETDTKPFYFSAPR
ncbi:MAG: hypothetical protein WD601_06370, partial [Pseudohongiellaceae bacterium]